VADCEWRTAAAGLNSKKKRVFWWTLYRLSGLIASGARRLRKRLPRTPEKKMLALAFASCSHGRALAAALPRRDHV